MMNPQIALKTFLKIHNKQKKIIPDFKLFSVSKLILETMGQYGV